MEHDKKLHFLVGMIVSALLIFVVGPWVTLLVVATLGAGKEAYDATGRGTVEFADFAWTVAGWAFVAAIWFITGL